MQLPPPNKAPAVLFWYRLYCGVECALALVDVLAGLALLVFRQQVADFLTVGATPSAKEALESLLAYGPAVFVGAGVLMAVLFALPFFLPRTPWAWIYHLALIGLGLTDCLFFLPCLVLMIIWLKPQTRTYFDCDKWMA
jgi:hypothetical protein